METILTSTIITKINGKNLTTPSDIDIILHNKVWNSKQRAKIKFESLKAFEIYGYGVLTLQTD